MPHAKVFGSRVSRRRLVRRNTLVRSAVTPRSPFSHYRGPLFGPFLAHVHRHKHPESCAFPASKFLCAFAPCATSYSRASSSGSNRTN
jgi:hypothetical protein